MPPPVIPERRETQRVWFVVNIYKAKYDKGKDAGRLKGISGRCGSLVCDGRLVVSGRACNGCHVTHPSPLASPTLFRPMPLRRPARQRHIRYKANRLGPIAGDALARLTCHPCFLPNAIPTLPASAGLCASPLSFLNWSSNREATMAAALIDPTIAGKYPVILGEGLLEKTSNDIFTGVRCRSFRVFLLQDCSPLLSRRDPRQSQASSVVGRRSKHSSPKAIYSGQDGFLRPHVLR